MEFQYELTKEEIEESLFCLDWKKEGKIKQWNIWIISFIALGCFIAYLKNNQQSFYIFLMACCIAAMLFMLYFPIFRRKRKAEKMAREKGYYKIKVPQKDVSKAMNSEHVITLQKGKDIYCIPKRILSKNQEKEIIEYVEQEFISVITERK